MGFEIGKLQNAATDLLSEAGARVAHALTLDIGRQRAEAEHQRLDAAEQQRLAEIEAARAQVETYLSQPQRGLTAIRADIASAQDDQQRDSAKIAEIEREIYAGDHEPSTKTATELTRLQLAMKAHSGKLARLQSELEAAEHAAIVKAYADTVNELQAVADELAAFEAGEWLNIQAAYVAGLQKRNMLRARLRVGQVTRRDALNEQFSAAAIQAVGHELAAIDTAHTELNAIFQRV